METIKVGNEVIVLDNIIQVTSGATLKTLIGTIIHFLGVILNIFACLASSLSILLFVGNMLGLTDEPIKDIFISFIINFILGMILYLLGRFLKEEFFSLNVRHKTEDGILKDYVYFGSRSEIKKIRSELDNARNNES